MLYAVRHIVESFSTLTVNLCSLDLSKAFDKLNLHAPFIKLIKRNIPVQILHLLENMIFVCHTHSCAKLENIQSAFSKLRMAFTRAPFWCYFVS